MRTVPAILSALFLTTFLATPIVADTAPLPPGQPAGMRAAQGSDSTVLYVVGIGALAAGIAILASSNSNGSSSATATVSTAP